MRAWLLAIVAALLLLTPWSWYTIGFDFHFEAFTTVFALLAGRDLWARRYRRLMVWVPLTLFSTAAAGGLLVVGIGIVALLGGAKSRRVGIIVMTSGLGWLALTAGLGAMRFGGLARGIDLSSMYGYLSDSRMQAFSYANLVAGLVIHPTRAFDMLHSHIGYVIGYVASAGVIGLLSRWGSVIAAVVLLPSALNANPDFIHFAQSFQSWPAILFLIVGCAFVLHRLAGSGGRAQRAVYIFSALSLTVAVMIATLYAGAIPGYIERVSPSAARTLAALARKIPAGAEVIASQGVIGRFSAGHFAFSYWAYGTPERYSVTGRPVVFILAPIQGTAEGVPDETRQAVQYVETDLGARGLAGKSGIWAYIWTPRGETRSVVLP